MRVIVVGAGIVGASAAHHLAAGGAEVVLVDRAHAGKATLAGAGIVCPWASSMDDGPLYELYAAGAAYYPEVLAELAPGSGSDIGHRRVGALVVADGPDPDGDPDRADAELDAAEARLARRSVGRPEVGAVERLSSERARALFPPLRPGLGAVLIEGGARVDGRLLAEAFLAGSRLDRVLTPALAEVVVADGRATGVRVDGETIGADAVVVAAGAWTAEVLAPVGAELGLELSVDVEPQKGQILHLGLDADTSRWPVVLPTGPQYLLAFDDARVVVGATRETGSGFDTRVTAAGVAEVLDAALRVAPGLADATLLETRVGLRPLADDAPTIAPVPGVDGLVVATGLGAGGLTMGPLVGRLAADLVTGRTPPVDVGPYALGPGSSTGS